MVSRNHARCLSCQSEFAIRISVGGGLQRFVFPCPVCSTQLKGEFFAEQPTGPLTSEVPLKPFELRSDDFEPLDYDPARETPEMMAVAVDTEVPVHLSMFSMPVTEIRETPFIRLVTQAHSSEMLQQTIGSVNELRELRFALLPSLRRAAVFYASGAMGKLGEELKRVPGFAGSELDKAPPWEAVSFLFQIFLGVIGADPVRLPASREFVSVLHQAAARDAEAFRLMLEEYFERALPTARRSTVDTFLAVFSDGDALVPGLMLQAIPELDIDNFRVQRSDFDAVKSRYQDIFELASRSLVLPALLANIAHRGDPRAFSDGCRRSLRDALRERAAAREGWLVELPDTSRLYTEASRKTRNLIGHRLVSYDYEHAALIDDAGTAHNYLRFLADYLSLVRTLAYVVDVVEMSTTLEEQPPWASCEAPTEPQAP
jgi:hypothetical protein